MKFLIITPLQEEAYFLAQSFRSQGFSENMQSLGRLTVHCFPKLELTIAQGGHGKAQRALQTQYLLDGGQSFDGVICMGAAKALSPLATVGDIVIAETQKSSYRKASIGTLLARDATPACGFHGRCPGGTLWHVVSGCSQKRGPEW